VEFDPGSKGGKDLNQRRLTCRASATVNGRIVSERYHAPHKGSQLRAHDLIGEVGGQGTFSD